MDHLGNLEADINPNAIFPLEKSTPDTCRPRQDKEKFLTGYTHRYSKIKNTQASGRRRKAIKKKDTTPA